MNARRVVLVMAILIILTGLPANAQSPPPEDLVTMLVDQGYLANAEGAMLLEDSIGTRITMTDLKSEVQLYELDQGDQTDFVIGSTLLWSGSSRDDGCGFVFHLRDADNFHMIDFTSAGEIRFHTQIDGAFQTQQRVPTDAIKLSPVEMNQLVLLVTGGTFEVFMNGLHVARFEDSTLPGGQIAAVLYSPQQKMASNCMFTGFWLWSPDASAITAVSDRPTPGAGEPAGETAPAETESPAQGRPGISTLTAYDQPMDQAVAELEDLGIIPSSGSEIFREPYAYFEGTGHWFTPLASYNPHTHIIMAGELTFTVGTTDELETCSFLARIITVGNRTTTFLNVGLTNDGSLFLFDITEGDFNALEDVRIGGNPGDPHHILLLAFRDSVDVYLDGELVMDDVAVEERAGTYGVSLIGVGDNARCEGRDIWGWEVDQVVEFGEDCGVVASNTVNLRSGPGTTYDRAGTLESGQTDLIVGQAEGDDGFVWWQLESGAWVRSDVVVEGGRCDDVPEVEP
jgi:hypothetical protein